jgi:WD40 repeat protein
MSHIFLSYSRDDLAFAERLEATLEGEGRTVWRDKNAAKGIPPSADWQEEIRRNLIAADTFLFIVSPHSIVSASCTREIELAVVSRTRIIPVVIEGVNPTTDPVPEAIGKWQLIFFQTGTPDALIDSFEEGVRQLRLALDIDLDYWHQAGDIADRARQWQEGTRDRSFLLRGKALEIAQVWLVQGASRSPSPSPAQVEFIDWSRRASAQQQRRVRIGLFGAASIFLILAVVASGLGIYAHITGEIAFSRQLAGAANGAQTNNHPDLALLLAAQGFRTNDNIDTRDSLAAALTDHSHLESVLPVGKVSAATYVTQFAYNAAGTEVIASGSDGSMMAWDIASRRRTDLNPPTAKSSVYIDALAVSPDGKSVAYVNGDGLWLWRNIFSGASPVELKETPPVDYYLDMLALGFSPDGSKLVSVTSRCGASLCANVHVQRWNVTDTSRPQDVFDLPVGARNTEKFADVAALSADTNTLVISCNDACTGKQIQEWDLGARQRLTVRSADAVRAIEKLTLSPDGHSVAALECSDSTWTQCDEAEVWDLIEPRASVSVSAQTHLQDVRFTHDGNHLVVGGCRKLTRAECTAGQLQVWDVTKGIAAQQLTDPFGGHINSIAALATSPDGQHVLTSQFDDNELLIWNLDEVDSITHQVRRTQLDFPQQLANDCSTLPLTYQATYSPDGATIAEATADSIVLLDAATLKPRADPVKLDPVSLGYTSNGYTSDKGVYQLSFSPSGGSLAAMTEHNIFLFRWDSGQLTPAGRIYEQAGGNYLYNGFSFDGSGARLAVINNRNTVQDASGQSAIELWDLTQGDQVQTWTRQDSDVYAIALSADGSTVAAAYFPHWLACQVPNLATVTAYYEHDVVVWDDQHATAPVATLSGHTSGIDSLAFSPQRKNGKILASVDLYGTTIVWDASHPTADPIVRFPSFEQQPKGLASLSFSADGSQLAVASGEFVGLQPDTIVVWDIAKNQLGGRQIVSNDLMTASNSAEIVNEQLISDTASAGMQLAWTVSGDNFGAIYTRSLDAQTWVQRACQIVNRNLTQAEWGQYGRGGAAPQTCPAAANAG